MKRISCINATYVNLVSKLSTILGNDDKKNAHANYANCKQITMSFPKKS